MTAMMNRGSRGIHKMEKIVLSHVTSHNRCVTPQKILFNGRSSSIYLSIYAKRGCCKHHAKGCKNYLASSYLRFLLFSENGILEIRQIRQQILHGP